MPDNVELMRRLNAAFNAGDVDASMELTAPDAELADLANAPDQPQAIKGAEAIRMPGSSGRTHSTSCGPRSRSTRPSGTS